MNFIASSSSTRTGTNNNNGHHYYCYSSYDEEHPMSYFQSPDRNTTTKNTENEEDGTMMMMMAGHDEEIEDKDTDTRKINNDSIGLDEDEMFASPVQKLDNAECSSRESSDNEKEQEKTVLEETDSSSPRSRRSPSVRSPETMTSPNDNDKNPNLQEYSSSPPHQQDQNQQQTFNTSSSPTEGSEICTEKKEDVVTEEEKESSVSAIGLPPKLQQLEECKKCQQFESLLSVDHGATLPELQAKWSELSKMYLTFEKTCKDILSLVDKRREECERELNEDQQEGDQQTEEETFFKEVQLKSNLRRGELTFEVTTTKNKNNPATMKEGSAMDLLVKRGMPSSAQKQQQQQPSSEAHDYSNNSNHRTTPPPLHFVALKKVLRK